MHDARRRPRWRYAFVSCMVVLDIAVMLLSLLISLLVNGEAYVTIVRSMPFELFLFCFSLIWVLCLALAGTYHRIEHILTLVIGCCVWHLPARTIDISWPMVMNCMRRSSMLRCSPSCCTAACRSHSISICPVPH